MSSDSERRVVMGVSGHIGAGKTSAARYLADHYGFQYLRYSQVLAEWRTEVPDDRTGLQTAGWDVMGGGLQPELNRRLIARIGRGDCAVDGLRHPIDYESLRNGFASEFFLLYVECPPEVRWERLRSNPRYASFEQFAAADSHPVESHIDELRPKADRVVANTGPIGQLYTELDSFLSSVRSGDRR